MTKPKTGGRQKGTPNRATSTTREWISQLLDSNREQIEQDLQKLEPKDRLQVLEKFMQYAVPKIQRMELTGRDEKDLIPANLQKNMQDLENNAFELIYGFKEIDKG
ncbi:MAG: hypothetical protein SNG38_09010 [Rikenellaceae bacterium]